MVHITVKKGLDIPIKGGPEGGVSELPKPQCVSLDVHAFEDSKFRLLVKEGDSVKIGQALLDCKFSPGKMLVSPGGGRIKEIRRGLKRRLLDIVVELDKNEEFYEHGAINIDAAQREELVDKLQAGGLFAHIRMRPCNLPAIASQIPKSIFVKAIETAPFAPSAELQVQGNEKDFQRGLDTLSKLTEGKVHLVYKKDSNNSSFTEAKSVSQHTVDGPHPAGNTSVHIHNIDPIVKNSEVVWTLGVQDVVAVGYFVRTGYYFIDRLVSIAGTGIIPKGRGYYKVRAGFPIEGFIDKRNASGFLRLISGDVLTGRKVEARDFLGFYDQVFCAIPEEANREFLHFFRLGLNKYSHSRTYLSGHLKSDSKEYDFTTNKHGEERAFIDSRIYDQVMPMRIPTMHLVKSILSEDFELAEELGILEVASEDFALSTFICPSKIEMTEIVKNGLKELAKETVYA